MDPQETPTPQTEPREDGLPAGAPDGLAKAAAGQDVTPEEERGALSFLLGPTKRLQYTVPVEYDTEQGLKTLRFRIQQMDERRLNAIDAECRSGDGPFAKLDTTQFNSTICAEGVLWLEDDVTGRVEVSSEKFVGSAPNLAIAMETRFKFQPGILGEVCEQIRAISGYAQGRVGSAQRVLVNAVGNS